MLIFITMCLIVCFTCTDKHGMFVKDVFKTDPETGETFKDDPCEDCELAQFCSVYMNEKHCPDPRIHNFPCDSDDPEQLKNLGITVEDVCDVCENSDACTDCNMKHIMLKDTDCLNCLAADYCKGIRYAMDPENPELVCPYVKTED